MGKHFLATKVFSAGPVPQTTQPNPQPVPTDGNRRGTTGAFQTALPNGAHVWYKGDDGLWWLGEISLTTD